MLKYIRNNRFCEVYLMEKPDMNEQNAKKKEDRSTFLPDVYETVEMLVLVFLTVLLLLNFAVRHSIVEGKSMDQTLYDGEHMVISPIGKISQGDIVVFEDYATGYKKALVKRVIATEGQTVLINSGTEVYVDGVLLDENYVYLDKLSNGAPRADGYSYPMEFTVGEGEIFVMGDHRNGSADSRQFGTVNKDAVLGKFLFSIGNR